jgi:cellulose synthase/poly-beta-1,6-N-acetylglucosamine synthase-like glycosyltransferase
MKQDTTHAPVSDRVSVIMPVYNARHFIERSLPPLVAMCQRGEIAEVVVVDDGSTDDTPDRAQALGAVVIPSGGRLGPGGARNRGASQVRGDILWFVDADVVVHDDAARHIVGGFAEANVVAVFGSYDDRPPAQNFLSQYKNLVHHYYHHRGRSEASTFWAGCGAVRKETFLGVGGFDTERFTRPSIEDIELGYRLRADGQRILLIPELQGTHLKVWRLVNLIHTEVFCRAVPWSRLMLSRTGLVDDLNVGVAERLRAVLAGVLVLVALAVLLGWLSRWGVYAAAVMVIVANLPLAMFFYRRKGLLFAAAGLLFHQLYYLYSSAAFAWCFAEHQLKRLFRRHVL